MTLLEALKHIRDNGPRFRPIGICGNLQNDDLAGEFADMALRWPKFSGLRYFPVPHPDMPADEAYHNCCCKWEGAYGDNRRDLLNWAIKELENELTTSRPAT